MPKIIFMNRPFDTSLWTRPGVPFEPEQWRRPFAEEANLLQYMPWLVRRSWRERVRSLSRR